MSAGRRTTLVAVLMTCAVLATTASAARAQMGSDLTPHGLALAPTEVVAPASSPTFDIGALRLGLPLQLSASLAAYRWLAPALGQIEFRQAPAVNFAQHGTVRSAWWRKRI